MRTVVYTVGHSTQSIEEFIELLNAQNITQLVDIRSIPGSRHNPQFGQQELKESLKQANIKYVYLKDLGGLRPAIKNSTNEAWHNKSFRNYADYMQTDEFDKGIEKLLELSNERTTAIMCAEAVPWRCHRSLVSDALIARSVPVQEIISKANIRKHTLTKFAVIDGHKVTYPKPAIKNAEVA